MRLYLLPIKLQYLIIFSYKDIILRYLFYSSGSSPRKFHGQEVLVSELTSWGLKSLIHFHEYYFLIQG